jgi:hypothetical protein
MEAIMKKLALAVSLAALSGAASAQLTLFEHDNFQGSRFDVRGAVENLGNTGFNDKASVHPHPRRQLAGLRRRVFRGHCITLRPGDYPSLGTMGMNDKVSSARELGAYGPPPQQGGNWGGGARAVLYSQPNFAGRTFVIDSDVVRNLGDTNFNDRASSLRIEQGYWMFCSDANFGGQCLTFGPGEYPQLPGGLENRISSGRRVSSNYPYRQNPDWSGYHRQ